MMLELFEALNGRLIGPKTWDRIIENFRNPNGQPVTVHGLCWVGHGEMCALNCIVMCVRPEMAIKFGFPK